MNSFISHAALRFFLVLLNIPLARSLKSDFVGLELSADGSYNAVELSDGIFSNSTCSPGGYRDFYIDVKDEHSEENLFVEAIYAPREGDTKDVQLTPISLYMYFNEIPFDRVTESSQHSSPDGLYSLAVNANEIKVGRYFISVQCGDLDYADFGVVAIFEDSHLEDRHTQHYMICPGETLYHYLNVTSDEYDQHSHVRFTLCMPLDSLSELTLVTKVRYPPLRRSEPMVKLTANDYNSSDPNAHAACAQFEVCHDSLEEGRVWAGIFGSGLCGEYNLTAAYFGGSHDSETCSLEMGGAEGSGSTERTLALEHVARASCEPFEWVDFGIELNEYDRENNIVFEVQDLSTGGMNPQSLSVHLFTDEIPVNRLTENRAETSTSSIYAVFKTFLSLNQLTNLNGDPVKKVYLSVRCGPSPSKFRVLGEHVEAILESGHLSRGEVCGGNWVFHYITIPDNANYTTSLDVKMIAYEGYIEYTVLVSHPPVRIAPPYGEASSGHAADVMICEAEAGMTYYIGVKASEKNGATCATYDIAAIVNMNDPNCSSVRQTDPDRSISPIALTAFHPLEGSVSSGGHNMYSLEVDEAHDHDNLLIEVELTVTSAFSDLPNALEVLLFEGEMPDEAYKSEIFASKSNSGLWSIAVSAHDLKEATYYIVVKGTDVLQVRYRIVALLIESALVLGHHHHGEICENNWLYFTYNAAEDASGNSSSYSSGHRRSRRLANIKERERTGIMQERSSLSVDDNENVAVHLSVHIWRYSGAFFIRAAHGYAPIKMVPPFVFLGEGQNDIVIDICNVGSSHGEVPETMYIGLLGSEGCPTFEILAHTYSGGNCSEVRNFAEVDPTQSSIELDFEHFTHGSCSPGGYTDFYLNVSESHADDNIIFEVEQLGDNSDPHALTIYLFPSKIPPDRQTEMRSSTSSDGLYSVAISSLDVEPGLYFLSVKCKDAGLVDSGGGGGERVLFRVAPLAIHRDLTIGYTQHGELCPGEWIHHRYAANRSTLAAIDTIGGTGHNDDGHRRLLDHVSYHARFHIWKFSGDFYALLSDHAPFKLMAPYSYLKLNDHELTLDFCNIRSDDEIWIGLRGGATCSVYDIDVTVYTGDCTLTGHERRLAVSSSPSGDVDEASSSDSVYGDLAAIVSASGIQELTANRVHLSQCEPNGWRDFYLKVDTSGSGEYGVVDPSKNNIIFEVLPGATSKSNPEAVSIYLHLEGKLPDNRADSELFALESVDGIASLAVPTGMMQNHAEAAFLSVRCGPSAVRFRAVAVVLPAELENDKLSYGEVCPGNWLHFTTIMPEGMAMGSHIRFDVTKYQGDASFIGRSSDRPLALKYPYVIAGKLGVEESTSIYVCNLEPGEKVYLGAKGGGHCASFAVTPHFYDTRDDIEDDDNGCSEETNAVATIEKQEDETIEYLDGVYLFGHCDRDGWAKKSFKRTVTADTVPTNLLLEVVMLDDDRFQGVLDAEAISVYLFSDPTPPPLSEREESFSAKSEVAISDVHVISANYIKMKNVVNSLSVQNMSTAGISIAVKCSASRDRVRFKTLMHSLAADMRLYHRYHSRVCPKGWLYHLVDLRSDEEAETQHRQRRLGGAAASGPDGTPGSQANLRIRIRILEGAIYQIATRHEYPPGFNSKNLVNLELTAGEDPESTIAQGKVVDFEVYMCGASGHLNYIGLFGDESGCAVYDIIAEYMEEDEPCVEGGRSV